MKRNRSYFESLIQGYLIVTIILVFAICFMNYSSHQILKKYTLASNEDKLQKLSIHIEDELIAMKERSIESIFDKTLLQSANSVYYTDDMYDKYILKNVLESYCKDYYYDFFIYFPNNNIISAKKSSLPLEQYRQCYFQNIDNNEFMSLIMCEDTMPTMYSVTGENGISYIAMVVKAEIGKGKNVILCMVIEDTILLEFIETTNDDYNIVLFDKNKELLFDSNRSGKSYKVETIQEGINTYEDKVSGEDVIMQMMPLDSIGGYIGSVTSAKIFWEQFSNMRATSIVYIVCFVAAAMITTYVKSKSQEKELIELMMDIQESSGNILKKTNVNEFVLIKKQFMEVYDEKNRIGLELKNYKKNNKDYILQCLLKGIDIKQLQREGMLSKYGICFYTELFIVGCIKIENEQHENKENLNAFVVRNVFEELFANYYIGHVISMDAKNLAFIINLYKKEDDCKIEEVLEQGKQFLNDIMGLNLSIAYGSIYEGIENLGYAYEEAKVTLKYKYLMGKGRIISYSNIQKKTNDYQKSDLVETILSAYMKNDNNIQEEPERFIARLLEAKKIDQSISLYTVEYFKLEVIMFIKNFSKEVNLSKEEKDRIIEELICKETFDGFLEQLSGILTKFIEIRKVCYDENDVCAHAKKFIADNYFDSKLSVEMIANALHISVSGLYKKYKNKYGIPISQDIINYRVDKAKELLCNSSLSISTIAEKTGFSDSVVFTKTFKKRTNITPGNYRKVSKSEENG